MLLPGIGLAVLYWILEAFMDSVFHKGDFVSRLFPADANELWMRGVILALLIAFIGYIQLMVRRRGTEERLHDSEQRLQSILDNTAAIVYVKDAQGRHLLVNRQFETLYHVSREQALGKTDYDLFPKEVADAFRANDQRVMEAGTPLEFEEVAPQDGVMHTHVAVKFPMYNSDGELYSVCGISTDITDLKQTEKQRAEDRFQSLVRNSVDIIALLDAEGTILYESPSVERLQDQKQGSRIGKNIFRDPVTHQDDVAGLRSFFDEVLRNPNLNVPTEFRVRDAQGSWRHMEAIGVNLLDDPAVGGIVIDHRDITERKRAERALRESEARHRQSFEKNRAVQLLIDPESGEIVDANPAACEFYGYPFEELTAMKIVDINVLPARTVAGAMTAAASEQAPYFVFQHRLASGEFRDVEVHSSPIEGGKGTLLFSVIHDITERKRAEEALRASEARFRAVFEEAAIGMMLSDSDGHPLETNPALQEMLGYNTAEFRAMHVTDFTHPDDAETDAFLYRELRAGHRENYQIEKRYIRKDSRLLWGRLSVSLVRDVEGVPRFVIGMIEDINNRKVAEQAHRQTQGRYRRLVETSPEAVAVYDEGRVLYVNPAAVRLLGASGREDIIDRPMTDFIPPEYWNDVSARAQQVDDEGEQATLGEAKLVRTDGQVLDVEMALTTITYLDRPATQVIVRDITRRKALEDHLMYQAFHDPLTRLPNRTLFMDRLSQALAHTTRHHGLVAVLFLDLDRFKYINDSLGHEIGDQLLSAVAGRLQACLRPEDTAARLAGDEFTVLLNHIAGLSDATRVAERIKESLQTPFNLGGHEVIVSSSVGIAISAPGYNRPAELLRNADIAQYRAKSTGKAHYEVFDTGMDSQATEQMALEADVRRAIERGEFRLYYQPRVDLATGKITGVEALLRWQHPDLGIMRPAGFIGLAREAGLTLRIGRWVLKEACRQAVAWQEQYPEAESLSMHVNVYPSQFQYANIAEDVAQTLQETGLAAESLNLEVAESTLMEGVESVIASLHSLRDLGVKLTLDDLGTGLVGLSYLKRLPINGLTIDRTFVAGLGADPGDGAIVQAVITLARALNIQVTAKGMENAAQLSLLHGLGCVLGQGYYFSKPVPPEKLGKLLGEASDWRDRLG